MALNVNRRIEICSKLIFIHGFDVPAGKQRRILHVLLITALTSCICGGMMQTEEIHVAKEVLP
ncbi:MAG: hypothetical protein IJ381_09630 [Clostridia bacterium]|nr:hypothetical protein [Clostridia bacterium]